MQNIVRKITAATIAAALLIPTTTSVATAQSSFGSSSLDLGSSIIEDPIAIQFERGYEDYIAAFGHTLDQEHEAEAEALLRRALNGELNFVDREYFVEDYSNSTYYWAEQWYPWEVEGFLNELEDTLEWARNNPDDWHVRFGVAVAKKGDFYYLAAVEDYGN